MTKKRNVIIAVILLLAIGFAGVATILRINGHATVGFDQEQFEADIIFTKSILDSEDVSDTTIIENGKKIKFETKKLTTVGESTVLDYTVTNKSNQYGARGHVKTFEYDPEYIRVENTPDDFDLLPQSNSLGKLTITLIKPLLDDKDTDVTIEIDVDPIDPGDVTTTTSTSTTTTTTGNIDDGKVRYDLTIDPDGGLYNGSTDIINTKVVENTEVTLDTVTKEGYIFSHWEVNEERIEENKIIITSNTTIKAIWIPISEAVARINDNYYLTVQSAFNAAKTNDEVVLLKDTEETSTNEKDIVLNLNSHKITGSITNTGTLRIDNGEIENANGSAITNTGTLTLGNNEGNVSIEVPSIIGTDIGIEQKGTLNFYDGVVEGKIGINGDVEKTPEEYFVFVDHNDIKDAQKVYLVKELNNAVVKTIKDGTVYYKNLQDSIRSSEESGKKIYAIRDFEAAYQLNISEQKSIEFDIDGNTVEFGNDVINNGNLTIEDSNVEKGILNPSITITNNGVLNIKNISITETTPSNVITNNNKLNITNSTITATSGYAVYNHEGDTVNLDENTYLNSNQWGFYNDSTNEITLTSGNATIKSIENTSIILDGNIKSSRVNTYGRLVINDGEFSTDASVELIYAIGSGDVEINGGVFKTTSASAKVFYFGIPKVTFNGGYIEAEKGLAIETNRYVNLTINNVDINAKLHGISSSSSGSLTIYNCNINAGTGVYASSTTNIYGGNISGSNVGIYGGDKVNIHDGNIYGETYGVQGNTYLNLTVKNGTINGGQYGIYQPRAGQITIGLLDDELNIERPLIKGNLYGIYTDSVNNFSFYNGKIMGKTGSYSGEINVVRPEYDVLTTSETIETDEYYTSALQKSSPIAMIDDKEYVTLSSAISAANENDTIKIIKDANVYESIEIANNKKIVIDLNGFNLNFPSQINNLGTLEFIDSKGNEANVLNFTYNRSAIINQGTVKFNNVRVKKMKGSDYVVQSTRANVDVINSEIVATTTLFYDYYETGTINIEGSTLKTPVTAITGSATGNMTNTNIISSKELGTNTNELLMVSNRFSINNSTLSSDIPSKILIRLNSKGDLDLTNSNLESIGDAIRLEVSNMMVLENTNITSDGRAIYSSNFYATPTVKIISGKIISEKSEAIYFNSGTNSKLIIGNIENEVTKENPIIIGNTYGVDSNAIYFYDGIVKGKTDAIKGTIISVPEAAMTINDEETIDGNLYKTKYLVEQENFARYNGNDYNSFSKILDLITDEGMIEIINDANITSIVEIPNDKNITIDLKGHALTTTQNFVNEGILKITDSIGGGVLSKSSAGYLIESSNELIILDANLNSIADSIKTNSGNLDIRNSSIECTNSCLLVNAGTSTVSNSNFNRKTSGYANAQISISKDAELALNNTNITNTAYATISNGGKLIQNGGIVESGWNDNSNTSAVISNSGEYILDYAKINATGSVIAILTSTDGKTIINNSEIISKYTPLTTYRISGGNPYIEINSGTIEGSSGIKTGSYATLNIGTNPDDLNPITITGKSSEGISGGGATINIGINNSAKTIEVRGETYGLSSSGTVNYNAGVISGITGNMTLGGNLNIPEDKSLYYSEEVKDNKTYQKVSLGSKNYIVKNAETQYDDLQTAIDEANEDDTLILINDINMVNDINVVETKKIKLDFNGHRVNILGAGKFNNNGELTLENNTELNSMILKNHRTSAIKNNGIMNISNINFKLGIAGSSQDGTINNQGTMSVDNSNFDLSDIVSSGELSISNAEFNSNSYPINTTGKVIADNVTSINGRFYISSTSSENVISNSNILILKTYKASMLTTNKNTIRTIEMDNNATASNWNSTEDSFVNITNYANTVLNKPTINFGRSGTIDNKSMMEIKGANISAVEGRSSYYGNMIKTTGNLILRDSVYNVSSSGPKTLVSISGNANVTLENNTIDASSTDTYYNKIIDISSASAHLTMKNNDINIHDAMIFYGLYVNKGNVDYLSGNIKVNTKSSFAYGIYINDGVVSMGIKDDGEVSTINPYVEAVNKTLGIGVKKVNGYFNFYDGKIVGSTNAKPDTTSDVEYLYEATIKQDEETGYEYCILESMNR
ncbi:MAG: hypothetical protein OSJ65_02425 [Bacilli bacterium]|nr:hypothetical protein [Bacilli bacterium]